MEQLLFGRDKPAIKIANGNFEGENPEICKR